MIKLKKILLESEDIDHDLFDNLFELKDKVLSEFASGKYIHQPWQLIKFSEFKYIWESFIQLGFVQYERRLDNVIEIITENILKIFVNRELCGHSQHDPAEDFEEYGIKETEYKTFYNKKGIEFGDYIEDKGGAWRFSDYATDKLVKLLEHLRRTSDYNEKIVFVDMILNVIHQRSDLASWFVQGGSKALSKLSGIETENIMIKLKKILYESVSQSEMKDFLIKFKKAVPNASIDDISNAIILFSENNGLVSEFKGAASLLKTIIPLLILIYGANNADSISKNIENKIQNKDAISHTSIKDTPEVPIKSTEDVNKIYGYIKKYSKQYNIHEKNLMNLLKKESSFSLSNNNYNPHTVGDVGNELGSSYGAGQIKVPVAKELYTKYPESDVQVSKITAKKLTNDVEFNIRTAAKLLSTYFHKDFKHIKGGRKRMAYAASAYNQGKYATKSHGVNSYGKFVGGIQ